MIVVLIPAYNAEKTIERAVRSAVGQHGVREVLVIDDGSYDRTSEVARHAGARVIVQVNAGPAAARNRGLDEIAATPDVHALFLDADDELREGATAAILHTLRTLPKAACVVGGHAQISGTNTKERRPDEAWMQAARASESGDASFATSTGRIIALPHRGHVLGTSHVFCTTGLTLTPRVIQAGLRFDPVLHFGEDRDLIYRAALMGHVALTESLLVNKYDEPGRMTASPTRLVRWLEDVIRLCDKHDPAAAGSRSADAITQDNLRKSLAWIFKHAQRGLAEQGEQLPPRLIARVEDAFSKRGWEQARPSRGLSLRRAIGSIARLFHRE